LAIHGRSKTARISGIDSLPVIVDHNVTEDDAFDLSHRYFLGLNLVELLRGKEAFHPGIGIATARTAHALNGVVPGQSISEDGAGELAAPVAVKITSVGKFQRLLAACCKAW